MIFKILNFFLLLKHHLFVDRNTKYFLRYYKKIWIKKKKSKKKNIILLDFFDWYPWILFWSLFANLLAKKYNANINYYYFPLYKSILANHNIFLRVRKKIYNSFNATEILNELNFEKKVNKNINFKNIVKNKKDLINFKYKNIIIGDLIYDSYLRSTYSYTIDDLEDKYLIELFYRALRNFDEIEKTFKKNNVKAVISSHTCYFQYGMLVRIACKKKIPVYTTPGIAWGLKRLSIKRVYPQILNHFDPYFKYKKIFSKFTNKDKKHKILLGKKILDDRFAGSYGKYLPHIEKIKSKTIDTVENVKLLKGKKKFVIYTHCFWDYVHKFRFAIFPDFYEWITQTIKIIEENHDCQIFIKPHPNDYKNNIKVLKKIQKQFPKTIILSNYHDLSYIVKLKPVLVITVFGTVGHELPYKNINVLCAGDNLHVNYKFNITAKNLNDYKEKIINFKKYQIKFTKLNKKSISEFCYMHYLHFYNLYNREKLIKDDMFSYHDLKKSNSSANLKKFCDNYEEIYFNFSRYFKNIFN
jgi:hypothetical protein